MNWLQTPKVATLSLRTVRYTAYYTPNATVRYAEWKHSLTICLRQLKLFYHRTIYAVNDG
jgi:hypothetical protein